MLQRLLAASVAAVLWGTESGASDTEAPSVPAGLYATAVSSSQINLSWTAATDNTGVTGYRINRNGAQIGTTSATAYNDTGLSHAKFHVITAAGRVCLSIAFSY